MMDPDLVPGAQVLHPTEPEWGVGHIQSVTGDRITVNFEHRGKVVVNGALITLNLVKPAKDAQPI